jgi:DNA-binding MarR family transcriptional regulator
MANRKQLIEEILNNFHAIRLKIKTKFAKAGNCNPITPSQWMVLRMIADGESSTVKDISNAMSMSSSAATQLVDGLVENGYVIRQNDPKDRRLVRITLSPRGKKHILKMKEIRIKEMSELFDVLTDAELGTYLHLNHKIASKMQNPSKQNDHKL